MNGDDVAANNYYTIDSLCTSVTLALPMPVAMQNAKPIGGQVEQMSLTALPMPFIGATVPTLYYQLFILFPLSNLEGLNNGKTGIFG